MNDALKDKLKKDKKLIIIAIGIFILLIIFIAAFLKLGNSSNPRIIITNLDDYVGKMPVTTKNEIFEATYRAAEVNYQNTKNSTTSETASQNQSAPQILTDDQKREITSATGVVRENSFLESVTNGIHSGSFIVDIEKLELSFKITYDWSELNRTSTPINATSSTSVSANCLPLNDLIYPYFKCQNPFSETTSAYDLVDNILPFYEYTANSSLVSAQKSQEYYASSDRYIELDIESCSNTSEIEEGIKLFKTYLEKYQLNPSDYILEIRDKCNGKTLKYLKQNL